MPNKITYTIKTADGKEHQVSKENIDKHGIQAYADAYEGATIRMRDSKKGDYDIPLSNYNDAKAQGLHAFSWEHLPPKAQPQAKQQVAQKQPTPKVNTTQGTPMTAAQKAQVLNNVSGIVAQSQADLSRTMRKIDYAKQNTGLDVKPIKLGENRKIIKQSSFNPQTGKKEDSYLTESGNIHDSYVNAFTEQNAIDDFKEQEKHSKIENQLNAAYKERDSITKALQRRMAELDKQGGHGLLRQFADAMTPDLAMHSSPRDYEMDEEYGALMSAARKNNSTIQILEDKKKGRMNNFWSTLGATFSNGYTFTDGLSGVRDNIAILNANKRADKINRKRQRGEMLTNEEDAFDKALLANLVNEEIEGTYGQEYGALARTAKITAGTVDFVKDFILSGGVGTAVTKGVAKGVMNAGAKYLTKKAGESLLKAGAKAFSRGLLKATGIGVGSLAGGALITNTTGIGKTAEEMSKQVTGRVGVDQHGNYIFTDSKDLMHAFIEAERSMIGENGSEMLGEFIPGSKVLKKGLEKIGLSKISSYLTSIGNKSWAKNYGKLLEAAGWNGLPGEGLEEYAGIAYNSLTGDSEGGIATLGDARTHIDIWLGCATAGALFGAPNVVALGANTAQYYRYKHATNKAAQQAKSQLTADRWNALQERIDNTENQDLTNLMLEVYTNKELSPKQKKAVFNYTDNLVRMRGYNIGSINNADATRDEKGEKELHKEENIGNAYATGYHATEEELSNIKNELELRQRQLAETFKDDPTALQQIEEDPKAFLQGLKESEVGGEKAKVINAYEETRAAYDGMIQRVKDNIDDAITENNTVIEQRTHQDGNIYSATMKLDDRKVYVVGGNVQMNEDGKGIDHEKSSSSVMVRDAETGKIEMVDPSAILSVDTPVNAEEEKATSSEQIKQTYAQEQANKIDGVLEFKAGDTYSILGEDQKQHTIQIIGEAIDEKTKQPNPDMVMASIDGLEPTMLPKEQIQAMNDEENLWRLDQSLKQDEDVENEPPHPKQSYGYQKKITLTNENGNLVRGEFVSGQNEDGRFEVQTEEPVNGKTVNHLTAEELDAMHAQIQEEQTNQSPVQGEQGESPALVAENATVQKEETPQHQPTALERIPTNEQGEPIYEQADPETAWDAIVEQTEGDESIAQSVADGMVADMEAAVRRAEKAKVKGGTTIAEKIAAEKERVATIEQAKATLEHWKKIASTNSRRQEAIQAEESRKAKEAALLRKEQEEKERAMREEEERVDSGRSRSEQSSGGSQEEVTERNSHLTEKEAKNNIENRESGKRNLYAHNVDMQGNLLDENGELKLETVNSIDDITDDDFNNPTRNIELPAIPQRINDAIGADGKGVIIKKNIFEKNKKSHRDLTPTQSRDIIKEALYNATLYGQNQKGTRPYNWILIHNKDKNSSILIEVNNSKNKVEVINWHYLNDKSLERKKRQAIREGGRILTLESAVANTSEDLSSAGKVSETSNTMQENAEKSSENETTRVETNPTEAQKEAHAFADAIFNTQSAENYAQNSEEIMRKDILSKEESIENQENKSEEEIVRKAINAYEEAQEKFDNLFSLLVKEKESDPFDNREWREVNRTKEELKDVLLQLNTKELGELLKQVSGKNTEYVIKNVLDIVNREEHRLIAFNAILDKQSNITPEYKEGEKAIPVSEFVETDKERSEIYTMLTGVFHDKGYVVGTDAHLLLARKEDYDKSLEGKVTNKKGEVINGKYPNWRAVVNSRKQGKSWGVNLEELHAFTRGVLTKLKTEKVNPSTKKDAKIAFKTADGKIVLCYANALDKALQGAKSIGAKSFFSNDDVFAITQTPKGYVICPMLNQEQNIDDNSFAYVPRVSELQHSTETTNSNNVVHSFGNSASQNDTSIKLSDTSFAKMENGEQKAEREIGWLVDHNIRLEENSRKLDEIAHLLFDGDNIDSNRESTLREEAKKILEENEKLSRDYQKNYSDKYFGTDDITANYILQEANERLIALGIKPVKESYYFQSRKNEVAQNAVVHLLKRIGIPVHLISRVGAEVSGQGNSRGWTNGLDIWLTKDNINAETPVHEYTHIWTFALMKKNPKLWAEIKNLLKDSEWVDKIQSMDEYKNTLDNEDLLYSEVLSRISGKRNGEKFESMAFKLIEEVNSVEKKVDLKRGLEKLRDALKRFWEWVGVNLFGMKEFKSVDDVCDRILFDLLNESDIARTEEMREYYEEEREMNTIIDKAKEDGTYLKAPNGEDSKLPEKEWAYARTKEFKSQLSDRLNLILNESKEDFKDWEKEEFRDLFKKHDLLEENNEPSYLLVSDSVYTNEYFDRLKMMQEEAQETMNSGKGGENVSSVKSVDMRDAEYIKAVENNDTETIQRLLSEEAERKGYSNDSSYQGSLAFNGSAPYQNAYFETKEERKEAWENDEYEDTMSLGDYVDSGIDTNDLEWNLTDPMALRQADPERREAIENLRQTVRSNSKTITIYRAVDANIKENEIRNGDWVTPSRSYAEYHIGLQDWENGRVIEQEVSIDDLWWDGNDIAEWGYDNGKGEVYKNTPNNRKMFEVTYDDKGNIIPLSERFNEDNNDIRYRYEDEVDNEAKTFAEEYNLNIADVIAYKQAMEEGLLRDANKALSEIRRKLREENKGLSLSGFVKKFSPIREALYKQFGDLGVLEKEYHDSILKERGLMEAARKREEEERKRQNEPIEELMSMTSEERDAEYMRALEAKDEKRMFEVLQAEAKLKGYSMGAEYQGEGAWKAPSNPGYSSTEERRAALEKDAPHLNIDDIANGYMNQPEDIFTDLRAYGNDNESGKESAKAISDAISDIKDGKEMPKVTVYRAVPTSVEEESLRNGDWVTPSKAYAKEHGEHRLDGDYRIIEQKVPANELWWDGNDIREWGFDNGKDYAYKNTENSRKLNDLITRDDQGNVILPSQRFNDQVEDERFRNDEELEKVNQRFNEELNNLTEANADKVTLWLGKPSDVLLSSGIENKPMKLYGNKVIKKMKKHGFALDELRDLPKAVADPIAVFDNLGRLGNRSILTELTTEQGNFLVTIDMGKGEKDVDFNIVSSVFGKGKSKIVSWIERGLATYINKKKALNYLHHSAPIAEALSNSRLSSAANIVKSFENPTNSSEKVLDRKTAQAEEVAEKEHQQMAERANELAETLHLDNVEIVTDASTLEGKKAKAKGFYSTSTGKITIVIPNHSNIADVEKTLLHESVAHYGLRKLFGEHFDNFLDNVFKNASEDVRREIVKLAAKNKWDFRIATEEYLASLAEDTNFEKMPNGLWDKVKRLFLEMLRSIGLLKQKDGELNDNELRYILWRSYKNLKEKGQSDSILNKAEDIAMQHRLKVGNYSESTDKEVRFRDGEPQSKERVSAAERYEQRVSRSMFQSQEALQDSMLGLKEAMDAIMRAEGKEMYMEDIEGFENAYLGENRLSSVNQAETEAFAHLVFKPMLDEVAKLAKNDKERSELTDYMMAKHGLERNEVMRKNALEEIVNNEKLSDAQKNARASIAEHRDYAGLTALTDANSVEEAESEAQRMVEEYEQKHDTTNLWEKVNTVTKGILSKSYECGMMNKQTYEKVRDMYQFYIPLRGFDEETSREAYAYLSHGQSAFNAPIKTAKGRSSKADDPFANMQSMAESAIMQGNRNVLVKQKFLNFALNHPSDLVSVNALWLKYDDVKEEWRPVFPDNIEETDTADEVEKKIQDFEQRMADLAKQDPERYKHGKDTENIPYRIVESRDLRQHQVVVKRNGRDYVLTINGNPRAAQALNGLTNPDNDVSGAIGAILNFGEKINRQLSAFYTTRNPDFVISNFIRDMLYANSIVWVKERPNYALRFHRNIGRCNPAQMKILLSKHKKGELDMNNSLEHMFHQFIMNGGETGYANVRDIEQHKNDIQRELKRANGKIGIKRSLSLLGEKLDEYNRAVENCARFAAFLTSREMGRTIDRSIYDAKDISVNFNKKGSGAKFMKATGQTKIGKTSAFISGIGRSGYVFWNAAIQGTTNFGRQFKRHPAKAFTASATMFILGALIAGMGMGDDGDDDKNSYWNLPESVRRSNILFRVGEQWVSIPLPVEYRSIYGMGELMVSAMSGKEHFTNSELGKAIAGQVTQILPIDFLEGEGGVKAFVPSAVKPFAEVISNKGWTGMPIYKDTPYNKNMPEWTKTYKSANKYLVGLAKILNEVTGGDAYTKGSVNINPAQIEYLLNGYFGGVSNTIDKLTKSAETIAGKRDYDPKSFLLLNRVLKSGDERTEERAINREYYRLKEEYEILRDRLKNYENDTDNGVFDFSEKINFLYNSPEYARYEIFEDYREDIEGLYKELKDAMSDEERAEIEVELTGLKKQMIEEMNTTRK